MLGRAFAREDCAFEARDFARAFGFFGRVADGAAALTESAWGAMASASPCGRASENRAAASDVRRTRRERRVGFTETGEGNSRSSVGA